MQNTIYLVYVIFYMVLVLVMYHKMFDVYYFSLGRGLMKELMVSFIIAIMMAALTLYLWWLSAIIIILVGLGMMGKAQSPTGKMTIFSVFVVFAIMTAVTGIKTKNETDNTKSTKNTASTSKTSNSTNNTSKDYTDRQNDSYGKSTTEQNKFIVATEETTVMYEQEYDEMNYIEYVEEPTTEKDNDDYQINFKDKAVETSKDDSKEADTYDLPSEGRGENDYILPNSDKNILTDYEVYSLSDEEKLLARNEIYARHGYIFNDNELAKYFNSKNWYNPRYTEDEFSEYMLSEVEKSNIQLIKSYESGDYIDDTDYVFADSSDRYLSDSDVRLLSKDELMIARNEIYARHGYIFNDTELANYFNSKSWYVPRYTSDNFTDSMLSELEKANIRLIKSYE